MNERILELAKMADIQFYQSHVPETGFKYEGAEVTVEDLEKFALLLIEEFLNLVDRGGEFVSRPKLVVRIHEHFGVDE